MSDNIHYPVVVRWCARECERQNSGEMSVSRMFDAWDALMNLHPDTKISESHLCALVSMVCPLEDVSNYLFGFRTTPVTFETGEVIGWENIPGQIQRLLHYQREISPGEFYQQFEEIHPFNDGNGRVGALLYNFLNGTLDSPEPPPDFQRKE